MDQMMQLFKHVRRIICLLSFLQRDMVWSSRLLGADISVIFPLQIKGLSELVTHYLLILPIKDSYLKSILKHTKCASTY